MVAESAGCPQPLAEAIAGTAVRRSGQPDIAGGVLEQAEHVGRYQPAPCMINSLRECVSRLFYALGLGETQQSRAGGHPPFSSPILKRRLLPTPAEVVDGGGKPGQRRPKALAIEAVDPHLASRSEERRVGKECR